MSGHERVICRTCSAVIRQCRCIDCHASHPTVELCLSCAKKAFFAPIARLDFSEALRACKAGKRIARAGWNGKGMFVFLQSGYPDGVPSCPKTAELMGIEPGTTIRVLPYLVMRTADMPLTIVPWVISQADALATDWSVLP